MASRVQYGSQDDDKFIENLVKGTASGGAAAAGYGAVAAPYVVAPAAVAGATGAAVVGAPLAGYYGTRALDEKLGFTDWLAGKIQSTTPTEAQIQEASRRTEANKAIRQQAAAGAEDYWKQQEADVLARYTEPQGGYFAEEKAIIDQMLADLGYGASLAQQESAARWGRVSGQAQQGAADIRAAGQTGAASQQAAYDEIARAAGQVTPSGGMTSGLTGAYGEQAYMPTETRTLGALISDMTGDTAGYTADLLQGQGSIAGTGRGESFESWANNQSVILRGQVQLAEANYRRGRQATRDEELRLLDVERRADALSPSKQGALRGSLSRIWNSDTETAKNLKKSFKSEEEYMAAVSAYISAGSRKALQDYWMSVTLGPEAAFSATLGGGSDLGALLAGS